MSEAHFVKVTLTQAGPDDAEAVAALSNEVAEELLRRYGKGHWSYRTTAKGVLLAMKRGGRVFVAREEGGLVAALTLTTRKPWAIDKSYFTVCARPLYLTGMAIAPKMQGKGLGRAYLAEAVEAARAWPADAIYLDAYDTAAGAGSSTGAAAFAKRGVSSTGGHR